MFRLRELRKEVGLSRADLSRAVGINQGTLANYENEIRQADYQTLILLARYFDVSVDYLLGACDDYVPQSTVLKAELEFMEKNLLLKYRNLCVPSKELVFSIIEHLLRYEK